MRVRVSIHWISYRYRVFIFYVATVSWLRCTRSVEGERVWWSSLISAVREGSFKPACRDTQR